MTARILALASAALLGLIGPSAANDDVIVRGNIFYRLHIPCWPAVQPASNLAPWYQWWPADANETLTKHDFQSSPYPGWPTSLPQAAPPVRPVGQVTYAPSGQTQPNYYQAVSYPRYQAPSYWYGR